MRKRASGTSQLVTVMRALAHAGVTEVRGFSDPTAMPMLSPTWRAFARLLLRPLARPEARARIFERSDGRLDLLALRTLALDEVWHENRSRGTRQLVILGAGLDGRAFRLDDLADSAVFEVDHPATQALKRARSAGMVPRARRHVYVPVDFERDPLDRALGAAGHHADHATFWIWEGVTQYLTAAAQRATLGAVARLSAPGSRIAFTYGTPDIPRPTAILKLFGEPWIGLMSPAEAAERIVQAGLICVGDAGEREWRSRFSSGPQRAGEVGERIAIGERATQP
jgi:methyltransferase (TIGR00027 family)